MSATTKQRSKAVKTFKTASALAGQPISLARSSSFDLVMEKQLEDAWTLMPLLTGYKQPHETEILEAMREGPGRKIGTVLGGDKATQSVLAAREVGGDVSLRILRPDIELGTEVERDLRMVSVVMCGTPFFTDDDAWLVQELSGSEETPEEMTERIHAHTLHCVDLVLHVSFPVGAAITDLLRVHGFTGLGMRDAVA